MLHFKSDVDVKGYTLVIPSVSVGNVGQLAVDLWISTLNCTKIGSVWHPAVMPVVGSNPYDNASQSIMVSCEVYCDKAHKLLFLQIRAPILKKPLPDFMGKLLAWVESSGILRVVVLTGSTYTESKDSVIVGNKLRYIFSPNLEAECKEAVSELCWTRNEKVQSDDSPQDSTGSKYYLPGCGFAVLLYEMCVAKGIKAAVLIKFCSEGDNVPDAYLLANYLNNWLKVVEKNTAGKYCWVNPSSWVHMFGKRVPLEIY